MRDTFCHKILALVNEVECLIDKGWSKKKVANELSIFPSVLSVITNRLVQEIQLLIQNNNTTPSDVAKVFSSINNISEKNLRQRIDGYIHLLQEINARPPRENQDSYLQSFIANTPFEKLISFCGTYDCYYLSSFSYTIKKEPLFMTYDRQNANILVQKGNKIGPTMLKGVLYTTNSQVLTIQMLEKETVVADQFIAHFILPPLYSNIEMLKGMSVSVSNSYLPISRKVILKKVSDTVDYARMDSIDTVFFKREELSDPIVNYLYAEKSYLEYYHTPHPNFDESDLEKELKILAATE